MANAQPVAVLDIGSNSVRMVVYERLSRALTPLFNEKSACALGRGVAQSGQIADDNAAMALTAIKRFSMVAKLMGVCNIHIIATSAVREASNGAAFMGEVEMLMGHKGRVLSGQEEAYFAGLGVHSGMPDFEGIVGDLGGGSLEFIDLHSLSNPASNKQIDGETFPLGAIRLQDDSEMSPKKALEIARDRLKNSKVISIRSGPDFCAIGGTWRALAKLMHMQQDYPLRMVQNYAVSAKKMTSLCEDVISKGEKMPGADEIGGMRRGLLGYGAAAMIAVLERASFERVVFSALGVREGYLFAQLKPDDAKRDPMIEAARLFCTLRARSPDHAKGLIAFTDQFCEVAKLRETEIEVKLRTAACYMSDIGWRGHPDYRGAQSVDLVAYSALTGVDHPGRAFLAETLAVRYMGLKHNAISDELIDLAGKQGHANARLLGALLRVAYQLSSSVPEILPRIKFAATDDGMELLMPSDLMPLDSGRLRSRLKNLATQMDLDDIEFRQG